MIFFRFFDRRTLAAWATPVRVLSHEAGSVTGRIVRISCLRGPCPG